MTGSDRLINTAVGAVSAVVAAAVTAAIASWDWTPERLAARAAAEREGPYASRPAPPPAPPVALERHPCATWLEEIGRAGVPADQVPELFAQIWAESRCDAAAVSPVGAMGLAQAMPRTAAEEFPRTDPSCAGVSPHDPACSARFQISYRERLERWLPPDARTEENELAAYNWGIGSTKKALAVCGTVPGCSPAVWKTVEPLVPAETRRYVGAIARYADTFRSIVGGGDWNVQGSISW